MTEKELECLKKEIRSVLISSKTDVNIENFKKDFRDDIGCSFPFRKFGYESEIAFLMSMPDVVRVKNSRYGPLLSVVADETTQHIKDMVAKQKPSKNKAIARGSRSYMAPFKTFYEYTAPPRFNNNMLSYRRPACLPADLKVEMNDIVRSFRQGISIPNISIAYKRKFNKEIGFQLLGFPTLEACIKANPELILQTRNNETVVYYLDNDNARGSARVTQASNNYSSSQTNSAAILPTPPQPPRFTWNEEKSKSSVSVSKIEDKPKYSIPVVKLEEKSQYNLPEPNTTLNQDEQQENELEDDKSGISEGMKQNFLKMLTRYPNGISAADFPEKYKEITGSTFELHPLGYFSLADLIKALPNIFQRKNFNGSKREWCIYPAGESDVSRYSSEEEKPLVNIQRIISNVKNILLACHEGIKVKDFIQMYNANSEDILDLEMLGFDNEKHFLEEIAEEIPFVFEGSRRNDTLSIRHFKYLEAISSSDNGSMSPPMDCISDDIVLPGHQYTLQELVGDLSKCFLVFVATVMTPSLFYIQLKGKETDGELMLLGEKLDTFYRGVHGNKYRMENKHVMIGATCAAVWPTDQHWYRVQITSIPSLEFVEAFYVDYGTKQKIPLTELRYLRKEYFSLPAQALKASLGRIQPPNGATRWDPGAGKEMLALCRDKPLQAYLCEQSDPLSLLLWDTNTSEDIFITDKLVEAGFAERIPSGRDEPYFNSDTSMRIPQSGLNYPLNNFGIQQAANSFMMSSNQNEAYLNAYINTLKNSNPFLRSMNRQQLIEFVFSSMVQNSGAPNPYGLPYPNPMQNFLQPSFNYAAAFNPMQFAYGGVQPNLSQMGGPSAGSKIPVSAGKHFSATNTTSMYAAQPVPSTTQDNSGSDSEVFVDDDDLFKVFCDGEDPFKQTKPVRRMKFSDGYKMHIIVIDDKPYVSCGDVSTLLWEDKGSDFLASRLNFKGIVIPILKIFQKSYEDIFVQLAKYKVKGIEVHDSDASISLYHLKNINDILSIFGHPSRTIRDEIFFYLRNFDPMELQTETEDPELEEAEKSETDRDKINKMCSYDLKAMLEALRCKKLSILRDLRDGKTETEVDSVKRIETWGETIKIRIKEIEELSTKFSNKLNEDENHQEP